MFSYTGPLDLVQNIKDGLKPEWIVKARELQEEMRVFVYGDKPKKLLEQFRPNEGIDARRYRLESYEATVNSEYKKVSRIISRIVDSSFFGISWKEKPAIVVEGQEPESFFLKKYGKYRSAMRFVREVLLDQMLADPNAALLILPEDGDYPEPLPRIYGSDRICAYEMGQFFAALTPEKSKVTSGERTVYEGEVYIVVDTEGIYKVFQTGNKSENKFQEEIIAALPGGVFPVRQLGGDIELDGDDALYKSFIYPAVPHWNKLVRHTSDLDCMFVHSMYPIKIMASSQCKVCSGTGKIKDRNSHELVDCNECHGTGRISAGHGTGPLGEYYIDVARTDFKPAEAVHFAEPPTNTVEACVNREEKFKREAMEALVMHFLQGIGENQSGRAKDMDRSELQGYLKNVSNHFWELIRWIFDTSIELRYSSVVQSSEARKEMVPSINEPVKFDYSGLNDLFEEIKSGSEAGVHPSILKQVSLDIINKRDGDPERAARLRATVELDPLFGKGSDDVLVAKNEGAISREDMYISYNIDKLLDAQEPDFFNLSRSEQREVLIEDARKMMPEPVTVNLPQTQ